MFRRDFFFVNLIKFENHFNNFSVGFHRVPMLEYSNPLKSSQIEHFFFQNSPFLNLKIEFRSHEHVDKNKNETEIKTKSEKICDSYFLAQGCPSFCATAYYSKLLVLFLTFIKAGTGLCRAGCVFGTSQHHGKLPTLKFHPTVAALLYLYTTSASLWCIGVAPLASRYASLMQLSR